MFYFISRSLAAQSMFIQKGNFIDSVALQTLSCLWKCVCLQMNVFLPSLYNYEVYPEIKKKISRLSILSLHGSKNLHQSGSLCLITSFCWLSIQPHHLKFNLHPSWTHTKNSFYANNQWHTPVFIAFLSLYLLWGYVSAF